MSSIKHAVRFLGYWIKRNPLTGAFWVEKDGAYICSGKSEAECRKYIEAVAA